MCVCVCKYISHIYTLYIRAQNRLRAVCMANFPVKKKRENAPITSI